MNEQIKLKRNAKGERPFYFDDPAVDKLLSMLMGLASEVSIMRDRLDTIERIAEEKGLFLQKEVEKYQAGDETLKARAVRRELFLSEITRIIQTELEGLQQDKAGYYDEAIDLVEQDNST